MKTVIKLKRPIFFPPHMCRETIREGFYEAEIIDGYAHLVGMNISVTIEWVDIVTEGFYDTRKKP